MMNLDASSLGDLSRLLRRDDYLKLQYVPFATHHAEYSARHLDSLVEEEGMLLAAVEAGEPVLYAYSLNPEHYARRLSRRQRLLGELFLYGRALSSRIVRDELPEYLGYVQSVPGEADRISFPLRLVPVYDLLCLADPIDATDDTHVFLHNDSVQMARYLRSQPALNNRRVADVGTGSGILAAMAVRQGASKVIAMDINPRALEYARTTFALNECDETEVRSGSLEDVVDEVDVIVSNPPYMRGRSALALDGGGDHGLDTALSFARCALDRRRHAIFILELEASGEVDPFIEQLKTVPSSKRILRRRPGYILAAYEFVPG